jgi:hypothetical protein
MAELDAILSGEDDGTEDVEQNAPQARGPDGRYLKETSSAPPAEPTPAPTPPPAATPPPEQDDRVPQAALLDERRKRQERERENQELRDRLDRIEAQRQTPPAAKEEPPKDIWDDPQAFVAAAERRAVEAAIAEADNRFIERMVRQSERAARKRYQDYDEMRQTFSERVNRDPVLKAEFNKAIAEGEDFGDFVYNSAKEMQRFATIRNADEMRAQIRKELEAELAAKANPTAQVPQSLNATPSPASTTETWSGPPPLEDILKHRKRSNST